VSSFRFGSDPVLKLETLRAARPEERGPKDVFHIHPFTALYFQGFYDRPGTYVWHCHMLEVRF
jgi:FtsP/CotA-like multicopper oxidase with cupredoxin domain